jgi:hypothetical protein
MALQGFDVPVSPLDDDIAHMKVHGPLLQQNPQGDTTGMLRTHIHKHMQALQQKQMAQQQGGQPGTPGGAGPGTPGQPKPGAMPMRLPTGNQNPPGALPADANNTQRAGRGPRGQAA